MDIYSALIPQAKTSHRDAIASILKGFPNGILAKLAEQRCIIRPLEGGEKFASASPALRRLGINVDAWPAPPAGLFVVEERTVYLRSRSPMTVVHESMHALDCALGGGVYRSGTDPESRRVFTSAKAFITPYAASGGIDEWFAESARAWVEGYGVEVNDAASHWPKATRQRLRRVCPATHDLMERVFGEMAEAGGGAQLEFGLR